ncbi:MAG: hypothetical protein JSU63_00785 [Phycisphaerales bacterium]|nr:MAG: hypothetical protein JSU63_00785 [Phycisphaerales bacterium]
MGQEVDTHVENRLSPTLQNCGSVLVGVQRNTLTAFIVAIAILTGLVARAQPVTQPPDSDGMRQDLADRLIRQAHGDADDDLMAAIIRLMETAATRLEIDFNAGEETQAVQQRIVDRLDQAIQIAARQRVTSTSEEPCPGDKRKRPEDEDRPQKAAAKEEDDAQGDVSGETTDVGGSRKDETRSGGRLRDVRRSWGNLPQRQRDEVIQGAQEQHLERFREWIERYYQALQESEESTNR